MSSWLTLLSSLYVFLHKHMTLQLFEKQQQKKDHAFFLYWIAIVVILIILFFSVVFIIMAKLHSNSLTKS